MSSKLSKSSSKSELSNKATSKVVNRLTRVASKSDAPADPFSPLKNSRLSVDRSQKSHLNSKPTPIDRRSPKVSTSPDKQQTRALRGSELETQLSLVQEELKNAKERLVLIEKEKTQAVEDLKDAQKSAEKANKKLTEAQVAEKRNEENSEIEKFRAVETEQAARESSQQEKDWEKELEAVQNQHAHKVSALLLATEELQRVEHEPTTNLDAQKVESLSAEVARLKTLLNSKLDIEADESKLDLERETLKQELEKAKRYEQKLVETEARVEQLNVELEAAKLAETYALKSIEEWQKKVKKLEARDGESTQLVSELDLEIENLKQDLENAKGYEQKLLEKEACIEKLNVELEGLKLAESYARKSMEEWQRKVKDLEARAKESNFLERSASESMESIMKQLEGNNDLLIDSESEIASLKENVGLLEISITRQRGILEETERRLSMAKEKAAEMKKKAELLGYELENIKEEKNQALNNEKLAAESVQSLLEEKNKLINELENLRDEEQRSKKAMESLSKDLHEVSTQAREAKERVSSSQRGQENYEDQIEHLRLVLNATNEKYKSMLDEAKHEIDILTDTIEQNKQGYQNSRTEWEQKEVNCTKKLEDENSSLQKEISKLIKLLKEAEDEVGATKEEVARLNITLKEAAVEDVYLKDILGETKAESMRLKESLLDKETELQSVIEENDALQTRETDLIAKIGELKKLIGEAMAQKQEVVNAEPSENEIECDLPPKVVECYEHNNGHGREENKPKIELRPQQHEHLVEGNLKLDIGYLSDEDVNADEVEFQYLDGNKTYYGNKKQEEGETNEVDVLKWEILETEDKELPHDKEQKQECLDEDLDSKVDGSEYFDQVNGLSSTEMVDNCGTSPSKQHRKKKKPLFQKFGSLLKRKGTINQK